MIPCASQDLPARLFIRGVCLRMSGFGSSRLWKSEVGPDIAVSLSGAVESSKLKRRHYPAMEAGFRPFAESLRRGGRSSPLRTRGASGSKLVEAGGPSGG